MPKKYKILTSLGAIPEKGYAIFHYFPVPDNRKPVFEHQIYKLLQGKLLPTFTGVRFLRPVKYDAYVIFVFWEKQEDMEKWKKAGIPSKMAEKFSQVKFNHVKMYTGDFYMREYKIGLEDEK